MALDTTTTVGKTIKVGAWLAISAAIAALLAYVASLPAGSLGYLVPAINVVLVFVKNLSDKNVENY